MKREVGIAYVLSMWILYPALLVAFLLTALFRNDEPLESLLRFASGGAAGAATIASLFWVASRAWQRQPERYRALDRRLNVGLWFLLATLLAAQFLSNSAVQEIAMGFLLGLGFVMCWPRPRNLVDTLVTELRARRRDELARSIARLYTKLRPGDEFGWLVLADSYNGSAGEEDVFGVFRSGIERHPRSHALRTAYARTPTPLGRHEEAIEQLRRSAELAPDSAEPEVGLAYVAWSQKRWLDMRDHVMRALPLTEPSDVDPRSLIALMLSCVPGELDRAKEIVEEITRYTDDPHYFVQLAAWSEDRETRNRYISLARSNWQSSEKTVEEEVERFRGSWQAQQRDAESVLSPGFDRFESK